MKASQFFISTLKIAPAEASLPSHQLMIRAGLIKPVASGLYTWMPMGLRVLRKVENIVREEMNRAGSVELLMPVIQPAELWQESGRWEFYGKELLRIQDRHERDFCMSPTCEEVITDIVRKEVTSYKQLPKNFYHINTKFRDEVRPRFGVMRAREFVMKDAYSFHADFDSLKATYNVMYQAYCNVFDRLGLDYRPVAADTGSIGGTGSHEFQVLAASGEDVIAYSTGADYAVRVPEGYRQKEQDPVPAYDHYAVRYLYCIGAAADRHDQGHSAGCRSGDPCRTDQLGRCVYCQRFAADHRRAADCTWLDHCGQQCQELCEEQKRQRDRRGRQGITACV